MAAHDVIRREQNEAEGIERLSAEYLTLATAAQAERWDAFSSVPGLTRADIDAVRASEAQAPLLAAFREAESLASISRGPSHNWSPCGPCPTPSTSPRCSTLGSIGGHKRRAVRPEDDHLIAGLIPRVRGVTDPDKARALTERDNAMESRARTLAYQAIEGSQAWVQYLGTVPADPGHRRAGCAMSRSSPRTGSLAHLGIGTFRQCGHGRKH